MGKDREKQNQKGAPKVAGQKQEVTVIPEREPTEAEEERTRAQAEESRAAAEESKAAAAHWNALARFAELEAASAEAQLEKVRNDRDREREVRERELADDLKNYTYPFYGNVDTASVSKCITQLNLWRRRFKDNPDKPEVTVILKSGGGSVVAGMALFDHITTMKREGWHFTTVARGMAASMAGILLQAGTTRLVGDQAYVLIHEIQSGAIGTMGEIEDEVEFLHMIQERILDIFAARAHGKITKATLRRKWRRRNWWLNANECVKLGIADDVG